MEPGLGNLAIPCLKAGRTSWGYSLLVGYLPTMHEFLGSVPVQRKEREKGKKWREKMKYKLVKLKFKALCIRY